LILPSSSNREDHYCLRVKGDSMIEDQIASGDYVVVKKQDSAGWRTSSSP